MSSRDKALEELKKQIAAERARLDPRVLEKAAKALSGKQAEKKDVPYDRQAAAKAIELFLQGHTDPKAMKDKILSQLKKDTH